MKQSANSPPLMAEKLESQYHSTNKKHGFPIPAMVSIGVVVLMIVALLGINYGYPNIFPGVTVGTIAVGGQSIEIAETQIAEQSAPLYKEACLLVGIYDTLYEIPVTNVLESIDMKQSAQNAYAVGRTGNPLQRIGQMISAILGQQEAQLAAIVQTEGLKKNLEDIVSQALTEPVAPSWDINENTLVVHSGKPGVHFDTEAVEQALAEKIRLMNFKPYQVSTALTDPPKIDIDQIAAALICEPLDATVSTEDGETVFPDRTGIQFDVEQAREIIGDGTEETYSIPIRQIPAQVTAADLRGKLFRDTLAQASTELNESNIPRTNNVRLATSAINGTILNAGDEFSYNTVVGERTEKRGYQPAGAYANGQVIEEFGGGVCQPSSTLYMAVLRADLKVTERSNHSFSVAYTPLGEDATVSWGGPDFRFRNDTVYPVKIVAEQKDGKMIMTLLGTKTSDKTVTTRTEILGTYPPETVQVEDSTLMQGQTNITQSGITGYDTRTYQQITIKGETHEVLANTSHYANRDQIIHIGTSADNTQQSSTTGDKEKTPVSETNTGTEQVN